MPEARHNEEELRHGMEQLGLDALIARSGRNVAYLSGMTFPGTLGRLQDFAYSPRAIVMVVPASGEPTLIASNIAAALATSRSWVEDVRGYSEYVQSPFIEAAKAIEERGLTRGRIGIEKRELGASHWEEIRSALPEAELIDCTDMLESVRNIKTPAEIDLMRTAVAIQDEAHIEVFSSIRRGETEREVHSKMIAAMLRRGADSAHGMLQASTTPMTYGGEGDATIDPGVAIRTDYVCYYQGYSANLSRMAVMGQATEDQKSRYQDVLNIHLRTIEQRLRAGVAAEDIYAFVKSELERVNSSAVSGLAGHSAGVWWHQEEPMFAPQEKRKLRPNMVVCLEPILDRFWHVQDQFIITDGDPELMSSAFDTSTLAELG